MPDWVRIGPPYGQINELNRPYTFPGQASSDVLRYGAVGVWAVDRWSPVPSGINPGTSIASWSVGSSPAQVVDASSFWTMPQSSRPWVIYNATTMPSGAVIARATVMLPYAATPMMVFELAAGATFAPFPVVPEIVMGNPYFVGAITNASASIIGSVIPATGSNGVFEVSRAYGQAAPASVTLVTGDDQIFLQGRFVTIQIKTAATVASGAVLRIQYLRLAALPVPWVGTNAGDLASAAIQQASTLVGTYYTHENRGGYIAQYALSRLARVPAVATIDAQQPVGQTFEIGSTIIAGQAQWGSDLVQKNYANSLLTPGDPLAFERIPNRQIVFPYINRNASMNSHLFARELNMAIKPGYVMDVIPEDAQANSQSPSGMYRRFDLVDGRVVYNEDIRYQRAGIARGEIQVQTLPYPRSASYLSLTGNGAGAVVIGNPTAPVVIYQPGDVPAPIYFWYSGDGNSGLGGNTVATGPSGEKAFGYGFMAVFVPSMATYMPIGPNATSAGGAVASIGNSLRGAGSQINIPMLNTGQTTIANGFFLPGQTEGLGGRSRVFAVMANATAATIPVYAVLSILAPDNLNQAGFAYSNIGFCPPLVTTASEMRRLSYVDLGEIRMPIDPVALGATVMWSIGCATGPSSNSTAGIFDSLVFIPIGDPKAWFGVVPTAISGQFLVSASNVLQGNIQQNSNLTTFGGQDFLNTLAKTGGVDVTQNYQGRSPYLSPGLNHVFCLPLGIQPSFNRRFTVPSSGAVMQIMSYSRFLFLQ